MYFKHPQQACMTYVQHCFFSLRLSVMFAEASLKAVAHAFLPDYYITSSSDMVVSIQSLLKHAGCISEKNKIS